MGGRQVLLDPTQNSPEVRDFEKALLERVVGQDRAVRRLARVYQVYMAGLSTPGRPLVNLLFLGPTGSGKTRLVEAAAEVLMGECEGSRQGGLRGVPAQPRDRQADWLAPWVHRPP
ncbi:MAG: hypothetical protein ABSH52_10670 [Terriglobia bacterium]